MRRTSIPAHQYAGDDDVLAVRFTEIENRQAAPARRPGVGDWVLDMDTGGNLVAVNLRTRMSYPVQLGAGTALPPS